MKYLFDRWEELRRTLRRPQEVLWLFDLDGTLSPIAKHPESVALSGRERRLLQLLVRRFPGRVGILSGRSLAQLRRKVASPKLIYGGAHGFEIYGPGLRWRFAAPLGRHRAFEKVIRWLQEEGAKMRGFWVEDKTWTCAAHYRQVQKIDKTRLYALLQRAQRLARHLGFKVQEGLQATEILIDKHWNKGKAVRWIQKHAGARRVFYMGDEATDETVFRILNLRDVGVRVGRSRTSRAAYYLRSQAESAKLLEGILTL